LVVLQEEAQKIYQLGMQDYSEMKSQLLLTNFVLVCSGSSVAALIGMADMATSNLQLHVELAFDDSPAGEGYAVPAVAS
jgi:hypothetical protein